MADPASNAAQRPVATTLTNVHAATTNAPGAASGAPPQPRLPSLTSVVANSRLLSHATSISVARSFASFLALSGISAKSLDTLCTVGTAIDMIFLTNENLRTAITERSDKPGKMYPPAFDVKLKAIVGTFSGEFFDAITRTLHEIAALNFREELTGADIARMDALIAFVKSADMLSDYLHPMSSLNNSSEHTLARIKMCSHQILDAIRAFHMNNQ
ncbi:hypothetical protein [Noviherbaspirillum pedocola]|uniref:Uncharacterized protein n=1 Tax=Noviherbaspirillum pedocola TaxID=2801341 RepID=A0A934ST40_9BURK|nr:hypothetical protein [Noviherbaspirillum pedocola]MBK4736291.1 hypothetical protein [Noviherbaspirillum pedocola]